jgi:hypothetical protein
MNVAFLFRWLRRGVAAAVLVLACWGAYWVGSAPQRVAAQTEGLVVNPQYLDFGEVWEDPRFVWTLPIENRSPVDITIPEFSVSCTCVGIEPQSLTIPAGQTTNVKLTLNLPAERPQKWDGTPWKFQARIYPELEGLRHPGWLVQGRVRTAFTLSARLIHYGDSLVRGQPFESQTVTLTPAMPLEGVTARCDPPLAAVQVTKEADRYSLRITPSESLPVGPFKFEVLVEAVTREGRRAIGIIAVQGRVLGDISPVPDMIAFGAGPLGEMMEETLVLQSRSGRPFEVVGCEGKADGVDVQAIGATGDQVHMFRVQLRISQLGDQTATIRFLVRAMGAAKPEDVSLPVSYHGMPRE